LFIRAHFHIIMQPEQIKGLYRDNIENYTRIFDQLTTKSRWWAISRLLSFAVWVVLVVIAIKHQFDFYLVATSFVLLALFITSIKKSIQTNAQRAFYKQLIKINDDEFLAMQHQFSQFDGGEGFADPDHPFVYDLDIFGKESIFAQVNRTVSKYGTQMLAQWFAKPLDTVGAIGQRQESIKELGSQLPLRQEFMALGKTQAISPSGREQILQWLQKYHSHKQMRYYRVLSLSLSFFSSIILLTVFLGYLPFSILLAVLLVNGTVLSSRLKTINLEHAALARQSEWLAEMAKQTGLIEKQRFASGDLKALQNKIKGKDLDGSIAIRKLAAIINAFDTRLNILMSLLLNGFFLWDFFCMTRLIHWKSKYKNQLEGWFEVLDTFDALQSLGNFSFNNPGFSFPSLHENESLFKADALGHPQIHPGTRVANDVCISGKGQFMIVTGPNMAGKSTFLRTVGAAIVMAQVGLPVCAREMALQPLQLFSSMRTSDSLHKNESYFLAELKRLREIIDAIGQHSNIFIILDEILKGTNSQDKAEGSRMFLKKIVEMGATGIVATHDLSLGELEGTMPGHIANYCFEADITGGELQFDYTLHRGMTTKMNASFLLRKMGIV
jgi:hypothetical protein